jgi:hypothetical protein
MSMTKASMPYRLLDLPVVSLDVPIDREEVSSPRSLQADERRQWRECDPRNLPADAREAVRIVLTRLLASLEPLRVARATERAADMAGHG